MRRLRLGSLQQISSVVMKVGWPACYVWISRMSLLLYPGTEFSQRCLTSAVKGQLKKKNYILTTHPAWVVRKTSYHMPDAHTHITLASSASPFQPSLFQVTQLEHTGAHPYSLAAPVLLLPIKIWRMKTVRWSFPPWHRGSLGNIQTALPQAMKSNRSSPQS